MGGEDELGLWTYHVEYLDGELCRCLSRFLPEEDLRVLELLSCYLATYTCRVIAILRYPNAVFS
jgi:hypothetical protein